MSDKRVTKAGGPKAKKSTKVPGQYWGYSLQEVRFLQLLMEPLATGYVSLEVLEDVARQHVSGPTLASQTKSGLGENPITDHAVDFWKTLGNWLDSATLGELDAETTTFEIYVARRRSPGEIARLFATASTDEAAAAALNRARDIMWGAGPSYSRRRSVAAALRPFTDAFLVPDNAIAQKIVRHFKLSFPTGTDPHEDLRLLARHKWVLPEVVDDIIKHAHGWVKERIDRLIQQHKPAVIDVADFNREITSYLPRLNFHRVLMSFASEPTTREIEAERLRTYVRQLDLVEASGEDVLEAINAYLRASVMRAKWGEEGAVHEDSFSEFAEALITYWRNKRNHNELAQHGMTPVQLGKLLLADCNLHRENLQGMPVPSFFTPGSYHALADELEVGWHPDYRTHIAKATTQDDK
jgi:hypothetical protein